MACIKPTVQDVEICPDGEGTAGIGQHIGFIPTNDVIAEPQKAVLTDVMTNEEYVTATGNFELVVGKKFTKLQTLFETASFGVASQGAAGQLSPGAETKFRLQNSKGAMGALAKIANQPGILALVNAKNENIVSGTIDFPAMITNYQMMNNNGEAYIELTFRASTKMPYYTSSVIPFTAAVQ